MFAGLLVDFQGAVSKMVGILPIVEAFLPLAALGGTTFFGLWSASAIGNGLIERRTKKFERTTNEAVALMEEIRDRFGSVEHLSHFNDYWTSSVEEGEREDTRMLIADLKAMGLAPPSNTGTGEWHSHLNRLLPHVRRHGVRCARAERDRWYKGGSKRGGDDDPAPS